MEDKTQNENIARNTLESARRQELKGVVARTDTLQATTALAKALLEKNRAQGAYEKALSVLTYSLGVPVEMHMLLPDFLDENVGEEGLALSQWLAQTQKNHPTIISARAQMEAAKEKVAVARAEGLPTLDFSGNYYQNGRPGQSLAQTRSHETTIGIMLTIPIFDG